MTRFLTAFLAILAVLVLAGCTSAPENGESLEEIAYDAFVYAYPMIEQVKTVRGMFTASPVHGQAAQQNRETCAAHA